MRSDEDRLRQWYATRPFPFPARLERLAGDASSRRYYRAVSPDPFGSEIITVYPASFDPAQSALQALDSLQQASSTALLTFANHPLAQLELTEWLSAQGLPVPSLRGVSGALGLILFSDLGDTRLFEVLSQARAPERRRWYLEALELLLALQRAGTELPTHHLCRVIRFSQAKLFWELEFFLTHTFSVEGAGVLPMETTEALRQELLPLCHYLAARPAFLCHRDYHARNLMVWEGRLYLIDYQDARMGPFTYDLVSLLLDPYVPPDWIDADELRHHAAARAGLSFDADLEAEWRAMAAQRLLKAAGTYAYQTFFRDAQHFAAYLEPTVTRALEYLEALGPFPNLLKALRSALDSGRLTVR